MSVIVHTHFQRQSASVKVNATDASANNLHREIIKRNFAFYPVYPRIRGMSAYPFTDGIKFSQPKTA